MMASTRGGAGVGDDQPMASRSPRSQRSEHLERPGRGEGRGVAGRLDAKLGPRAALGDPADQGRPVRADRRHRLAMPQADQPGPHAGWCRAGWSCAGWCCSGWCCAGWCCAGWCWPGHLDLKRAGAGRRRVLLRQGRLDPVQRRSEAQFVRRRRLAGERPTRGEQVCPDVHVVVEAVRARQHGQPDGCRDPRATARRLARRAQPAGNSLILLTAS